MFSFSIKGSLLSSISAVPLEKDFTFIVDNKEFACNKFIACCISQKVQNLLKIDPTLSTLKIEGKDKNGIFERIMLSTQGQKVKFTEDENQQLFQMSIQLGNQQLIDYSAKQALKALTIENCFSTLNYFLQIGISVDNIIDFISQRLYQIPVKDIPLITLPILRKIISMKPSQMNQQSLIDWINQYTFKYGDNYAELIDSIDFSNLPSVEYVKLASHCTNQAVKMRFIANHIDKITKGIEEVEKKTQVVSKTFDPGTNCSVYGVFSYLTQMSGSNVVKNMLIGMYAETNAQFLPDLVELSGPRKNKHYKNEPIEGQNNAYILFDFHQMRITLTAYTIVSCYCTEPGCEPKSWEILGSEDMEDWHVLDKVTDNDELVGRYKKHTFACTGETVSVRYVKYVQLQNHYNNSIIHLSGIEFFGTLTNIPHDILKKSESK